jgi:hypothetical protein
MRKLMIGAAAASALAVPVAAQAHGTEHHHKQIRHSQRSAAPNCSTLHTYRFRARGRFVSFVPSTTPGAAATDGTLTVLLHHVRRGASSRYLRSLARPLKLPRLQAFTLTGSKVHFRQAGRSFTNATPNDVVLVHGKLLGPARGCAGAWTLTVKHVFSSPAPFHRLHSHRRAAHKHGERRS